jgi:hypothetical protein
MTKIAGSESGSVCQRHESADRIRICTKMSRVPNTVRMAFYKHIFRHSGNVLLQSPQTGLRIHIRIRNSDGSESLLFFKDSTKF